MIERVAIEDTASPAEVVAVEKGFSRAGLTVRVEPIYGRRSAGALPWIVHVTLAAPIAAFFVAFASEAGKDAYARVKTWVLEVFEVRKGSGSGEGALVLEDPDHTNLVLSSRIPDEALDALRDVNWSEKRGDYLTWDEDRAEWRDATKRE